MGFATRDNQGGAVKATYCEVNGVGREIFKDPITDDGTKKSAKGLMKVVLKDNKYTLIDQVSWDEEHTGELQEVFKNGKLLVNDTLSEIRNRLI